MASSVWAAFDQFRRGMVDLDPNQTARARVSRDYLYNQIEAVTRKDSSFPALSGGFMPYGSFARKTKIQPLDDIDFLMFLNGSMTRVEPTQYVPHLYWLRVTDSRSPLAKFLDDHGYANSTKVLNRIASHLSSIPQYRKAEVKKSLQAVTLNLTSYDWSFDIVPAVPILKTWPTTEIDYYLIPNGHGHWIRTDPRRDQAQVTEVNKRHGGNFLGANRLLKRWNMRPTKPRLSSYYFETLCVRTFQYAPVISSYPSAVEYFFGSCPTYLLSSCPDPKGLGPDLDANIDWTIKQKVGDAMKEAWRDAWAANRYESEGKQKEAINSWRLVFGQEFPIYG